MTSGFKERMLASAARKGSRVVLALDFSDPYERRLPRAVEVLGATRGKIAAVKVNHHLLLPFGLRGLGKLVDMCKEEGLPLIADLKLNDIESTNLNAVESLMDHGFDAVIANPFVGKEEGLGKVIDQVHSRSGGVILLVYMSHRGAEEGYSLRLEGGEPMHRVFAERARDWGADGIIVSARSDEMIREARAIVGKDCLIISPGVGSQGGSPGNAIKAGADFLVVGRSITDAPRPAEALSEFQG